MREGLSYVYHNILVSCWYDSSCGKVVSYGKILISDLLKFDIKYQRGFRS